MVEPESASIRSARMMIAKLPAESPQRQLLFGLVNAMQTARRVDVERVVPRLRAFARQLEGEEWAAALAADVYRTASRLAGEEGDDEEEIDRLARMIRFFPSNRLT